MRKFVIIYFLLTQAILGFLYLLSDDSNSHISRNDETQNTKIYFLKTHKTASSVLENILMRYSWFRNRTLARPKWRNTNGGLHFDIYNHFVPDFIRKIPGVKTPDVLAQHTRYSKEVNEVFPKNSSYKFSILREPVSHFKSIFNYFHEDVAMFKKFSNSHDFISSDNLIEIWRCKAEKVCSKSKLDCIWL